MSAVIGWRQGNTICLTCMFADWKEAASFPLSCTIKEHFAWLWCQRSVRPQAGRMTRQLQPFITADVSFTSAAHCHFLRSSDFIRETANQLFGALHFSKLGLARFLPKRPNIQAKRSSLFILQRKFCSKGCSLQSGNISLHTVEDRLTGTMHWRCQT